MQFILLVLTITFTGKAYSGPRTPLVHGGGAKQEAQKNSAPAKNAESQPKINYTSVELKDGSKKQVVYGVTLEKDGLKFDLRVWGHPHGDIDIWDPVNKKGMYDLPEDKRNQLTEQFKKDLVKSANASPELKNTLMELEMMPPDEAFTAKKEEERKQTEKANKEKAANLAGAVKANAEVLGQFVKKNSDGTYAVSDEKAQNVKKDFASKLGLDPANVSIEGNKKTGSAFWGDTIRVTDKKSRDQYLIDRSGNSVVIERGQAALMHTYNGNPLTITQKYDPEAGNVTTSAFMGATPMKVLSFSMLRDGGSITAAVQTPEGKTLFITRNRGDNSTIQINDK